MPSCPSTLKNVCRNKRKSQRLKRCMSRFSPLPRQGRRMADEAAHLTCGSSGTMLFAKCQPIKALLDTVTFDLFLRRFIVYTKFGIDPSLQRYSIMASGIFSDRYIPRDKPVQKLMSIPPAGARHLLQQVLQIFVWLQSVRLCRFYNAVDRGAGLRSSRRIAEQPVLSAHYERTDGVFVRVVGDGDPPIQKKAVQDIFLSGGIANGLTQRRIPQRVYA